MEQQPARKTYFRALLEGAALARALARQVQNPAERHRHYQRAISYIRSAKGYRNDV